MVFVTSSIFIASAANEKKNTFCKNVYKPQVANKLNIMKPREFSDTFTKICKTQATSCS